MFDPDYDLLCGVPRQRTIYHVGGWYTVAATDIGRAPQPEVVRTGNERLDPEPMPPGQPIKRTASPPKERQRLPKTYAQPEHYAQVDAIIAQRGEMWVGELAQAVGLSPTTLQSYLWRNKSRYQVEKVRHENGHRRLIVRVRHA